VSDGEHGGIDGLSPRRCVAHEEALHLIDVTSIRDKHHYMIVSLHNRVVVRHDHGIATNQTADTGTLG